jgi:hypothetical protein
MLAESGQTHMLSESVWEDEIDSQKHFMSIPIIRSGELVLGLFTSPKNIKLLTINHHHQIKNFTAVVQRTWIKDHEILNLMDLKKLYETSSIESMFRMVYHQRVDFLLWTFSTLPDQSQTMHDITLVPVPNVKISIPHARRFIVSKEAPNSSAVYSALQAGLSILRERGAIDKAFEQSLFIHQADNKIEIPLSY